MAVVPTSFNKDWQLSKGTQNTLLGGAGAAAGAGAGGKLMYTYCSRKCVAPAACFALKGCLDSCANKAFLAGMAGGGLGSMGASGLHRYMAGSAGPLDEWTAGPVIGTWNRLEDKTDGTMGKQFQETSRSQMPRRRRQQSEGQFQPIAEHGDFL
uniref:Uncharacterized protein n=1 Tax=Alexandrium andersonii TaxID=327968 RepID=A0A7S2IRI3_9DINO